MANREHYRILNDGYCPFCGSQFIHVLTTDKPARRLHCKICDRQWMTLEANLCHPGWLNDLIREVAIKDEFRILPPGIQKELLKFASMSTYT